MSDAPSGVQQSLQPASAGVWLSMLTKATPPARAKTRRARARNLHKGYSNEAVSRLNNCCSQHKPGSALGDRRWQPRRPRGRRLEDRGRAACACGQSNQRLVSQIFRAGAVSRLTHTPRERRPARAGSVPTELRSRRQRSPGNSLEKFCPREKEVVPESTQTEGGGLLNRYRAVKTAVRKAWPPWPRAHGAQS
jgi:hypothetical protein